MAPRSSPGAADAPIAGIESLVAPFHEAVKPRARFRVGSEAEKLGLVGAAIRPVPFEGPAGIQAVLAALADNHGWAPERERADGEVISLERDGASITLEPAGQLELSGAPLFTIHEVRAELDRHLRELAAVSAPLGIRWLSVGFHPFARQEDLPHVPKMRYPVMRRYLPTRGPRALDMMRRTCTVQTNLDYESESDAMRKLRVSLALQPIVTAMFANSPIVEGAPGSRRCERAAVWLGMDPDRSGLLPFAWRSGAGFRDYIEWALDVPMFVVRRGDDALDATHLRFRDYMANGLSGHQATRGDWETHLNTLFPEARLKRTIELRGADAQPPDLVCAVSALWKGLLYDATSLAAAERLASGLAIDEVQRARAAIAERALGAELLGRPVQAWAESVIDLARAGLVRQAVAGPNAPDESVHLDLLARLVASGRTPADVLLARVHATGDLAASVVEHGTTPLAERLDA